MTFYYKKCLILYVGIIAIINALFIIQPISGSHKWRQADTAAVARNFYLESSNIFYPRIDLREDKSGITGMEFPLYQYITSIYFRIFGNDSDNIAKSLSLLYSLGFIFYLAKIFELKFGVDKLISTPLILSSPMLLEYGTKVLPDPLALCLMTLAFWFYYQPKKISYLSILFFSMSILIRPYLILWGLIFLYDFFKDLKQKKVNFLPLLVGVISLCAFSAWYFYWSPNLRSSFGIENYFNLELDLSKNLRKLLSASTYLGAVKALAKNYLGWIIAPFFLYSLKFNARKFIILFLTFFLIIVAIAGDHYVIHNYYLFAFFPLVFYPVIKEAFQKKSLLGSKKAVSIFFLLLLVNLVSSKSHFLLKERYYQSEWPESFVATIERQTGRDDLFVVTNRGDLPYHLYSIRRRGWSVTEDKLKDVNFLEDVKSRGAKWIVKVDGDRPLLLSPDEAIDHLKTE